MRYAEDCVPYLTKTKLAAKNKKLTQSFLNQLRFLFVINQHICFKNGGLGFAVFDFAVHYVFYKGI